MFNLFHFDVYFKSEERNNYKSGRSVEHTYYYLTLINHINGFYYDKKYFGK